MNSEYQHERQVKIIIDKYHHEAIQAKQLRVARSNQPERLATVMTSLRAAITAQLIAAGEYLRQGASPHPEPVAEPADTAVTV